MSDTEHSAVKLILRRLAGSESWGIPSRHKAAYHN